MASRGTKDTANLRREIHRTVDNCVDSNISFMDVNVTDEDAREVFRRV